MFYAVSEHRAKPVYYGPILSITIVDISGFEPELLPYQSSVLKPFYYMSILVTLLDVASDIDKQFCRLATSYIYQRPMFIFRTTAFIWHTPRDSNSDRWVWNPSCCAFTPRVYTVVGSQRIELPRQASHLFYVKRFTDAR